MQSDAPGTPAAAAPPWRSVPAEVGVLLGPRLPSVVDKIVARVRAEVPEYDQPLEGEFGRTISTGVSAALAQFVGLLGRDEDLPAIGVYATMGRGEFRAGRTLDALQSAYRIGARVAWRDLAEFGEEAGLEPRVMYDLAEAIFAYIDRLAAASVAGYTQEEAAQAGSAQARRHALIELLAGDFAPDPAVVQRAADHAGWPLPSTLAVLAVGEDADAVALARRLPPGTIGASLEPVGLLLVPDPDAPGHRQAIERVAASAGRAALGPTVAAGDAHHSARRALTALEVLAEASGLIVAEEHLLELLLARDERLTADLRARALRPLDGLPDGARARALETLGAWLEAHGDVSAAADALHVHPQTVRYRLAGLRERFGDALDDPRRRLELQLSLAASSG